MIRFDVNTYNNDIQATVYDKDGKIISHGDRIRFSYRYRRLRAVSAWPFLKPERYTRTVSGYVDEPKFKKYLKVGRSIEWRYHKEPDKYGHYGYDKIIREKMKYRLRRIEDIEK